MLQVDYLIQFRNSKELQYQTEHHQQQHLKEKKKLENLNDSMTIPLPIANGVSVAGDNNVSFNVFLFACCPIPCLTV